MSQINNKKYKAVGFDYAGVLAGTLGRIVMVQMAQLLGVTLENLREVYSRYGMDFNNGKISLQTLWLNICSDLGSPERSKEAADAYDRSFSHEINTDVLALADRLRTEGYKVGVFSNGTNDLRPLLMENGLAGHFDALVISAEVGKSKPDIAAFQILCDKLDIRLDELVFIDDTKRSLVNLPSVGACPILFTDYATLVVDLTKLGILE